MKIEPASRKPRSLIVRGEGIFRLRDAWRMTQEDFGAAIGQSRAWVQMHERPGDQKIDKGALRGMAKAAKLSPAQMFAMLHRPPEMQWSDQNLDRYSETKVPEVPLFALSVAAGSWADVSDEAEVRDPCQIDEGLFRIRLSGDSMAPQYRSGEIVEFRCLREGRDALEIGRDYYVQKDGLATFKRLVRIDEDQYVFAALNRRKYPQPFAVARREVSRLARAVAKVAMLE